VHNGGIREWAGTVPLCINPAEDFDINTNVSCSLQGLVTRRFLRIDPEEPVTKLIEPDDFKKTQALPLSASMELMAAARATHLRIFLKINRSTQSCLFLIKWTLLRNLRALMLS